MSGETKHNVSGWTVDTLLSLMDERDKRYSERFDAQEKAVAAAQANSEKWQANANEWRTAMNDREREFARKGALDDLKARMDKTEGSGLGKHAMLGYFIAAVSVISAIVTIVASRLLS